jgi:hypothetical protein
MLLLIFLKLFFIILNYFTLHYLWLFMVILLMVINNIILVPIGDYLKLNYYILLMDIGGYWCLFKVKSS